MHLPPALINNHGMKCLKCGAAVTEGQNFCGGCGHQLRNICSGCGTINPPFFKFCGQCGRNLADVGTLLLDRAGLISEADAAATDLLAPTHGALIGKPFSLYVNVDDLVLYYSHWNELIRTSRRQNLEIELNTDREAVIHAQLVLRRLTDAGANEARIRMEIGDVTDRRQILQSLQENQDLIELIGSLTEAFHLPNQGPGGKTIGSLLEKIGLVAEGQYGFVARIDVARKQLVTEFKWHAAGAAQLGAPGETTINVKRLRAVLEKLLKGRLYDVEDIAIQASSERHIWRTWHGLDTGAVLCQMIYRGRRPVGVIGLAKPKPGRWSRAAVLLIKLAARLMAGTLPRARPGSAVIQRTSAGDAAFIQKPPQAAEIIDVEEIEVIIDEEEDALKKDAPTPERMEIVTDTERGSNGGLRLFAADGADYQMTCPKCGRREAIAPAVFEKMGAVLRVNCPCHCSFRIIREMRHTYRKAVRLDGLFAQDVSDLNKMAVVNVWGPMVVTNISKTGLKFTAQKASLLRNGDRVHLRFYLDNSAKTLIKKSAQVKSIQGDTVGCEFLGSDRYDVTLGFYFL